MPLLSEFAQRKKIDYFLSSTPENSSVLEVGCGSGWVGDYFGSRGFTNYQGIDLVAPADVVGDIQDWEKLGMKANSFDFIIAFEVVEHVDIYPACEALLKPKGKLMVTTPVPHFDWVMKGLETVGLNQTRTSPHSNLHYLKDSGDLELVSYRRIGGLSQWGIFQKN